MAALCSDVWQNRKRTSLSVLVKAYLLDMVGGPDGGNSWGAVVRGDARSGQQERRCWGSASLGWWW